MAEVHEPEPTPIDDKKWLDANPKVRGAIIIAKKLIVPTLVILLPLYFNFRIDREKLRADAGYGVVAPAMKKIQDQIETLNKQMEDLQKLVLAQSVKPLPSIPAATIETNLALESYKKKLTVSVQKSQSTPPPLQRLPEKLDDVSMKK